MELYVATPDSGRAPAVIVTHEIWGLEDQIRGVAKRFAEKGFAAFAPNLYTRHKSVLTPKNIENAMYKFFSLTPEERQNRAKVEEVMKQLDETGRKVVEIVFNGRQQLERQMVDDLRALVSHVRAQPFVDPSHVGATGFCMGGGLTFQLVTEEKLQAAVIFYGSNPKPIENVRNIECPVMGLYAGEDMGINAGLPELVDAMVKSKKQFEMKIYKGCVHAFFNETRPTYNKEAAEDAWDRTVKFFSRYLGVA